MNTASSTILPRIHPQRLANLRQIQVAKAANQVLHTPSWAEVELQRHERDNLRTILDIANWKTKGPDGAAELLGVNPTTLLSRMNKRSQRPTQFYNSLGYHYCRTDGTEDGFCLGPV